MHPQKYFNLNFLSMKYFVSKNLRTTVVSGFRILAFLCQILGSSFTQVHLLYNIN